MSMRRVLIRFRYSNLVAVFVCGGLLASTLCIHSAFAFQKSDREKEGLIDNVHTVVTKASPHLFVDAYDPEGKLLEQAHDVLTWARKDPFPTRLVYTYDAKGYRTKATLYSAARTIKSITLYSNDLNGNTTAAVTTSKDDSSSTTNAFVYDDRGNRTRITSSSGSQVIVDILYDYDGQGNRIKEVHSGVTESEVHNSYDAQGRITEQLTYAADQSLRGKRIVSYDDRGNKSAETSYSKDGSVQRRTTYAYEYDSVGNWIKTMTREWVNKEGQLVPGEEVIEERIITYYREER